MVPEVIGSMQNSWVMGHLLQDHCTGSLLVTAEEKVGDNRLIWYHKIRLERAVTGVGILKHQGKCGDARWAINLKPICASEVQ